MQVTAENYGQMRACFAILSRHIFSTHIGTDADPVAALDRIAAKSPAKAREGLSMALNDFVEMAAAWRDDQIAALDSELSAEGLPTLSKVRATFSKDVRRVLRRGEIKNDVEYYAFRNAAELIENDQEQIWRLLAAYDARITNES